MSEEWGPWIEHDGRSVPVTIGTYIHVAFEDGDEWTGIEGQSGFSARGALCLPDDGEPWSWIWDHPKNGFGDSIIRYRIRKPRALQELIALVADPYAVPPAREVVPA